MPSLSSPSHSAGRPCSRARISRTLPAGTGAKYSGRLVRLALAPLDQPRVAELVGILSGIVPDAEPGIVLRRADGPRLPRDDLPERRASLLCERDIKRGHGRHGNVGHGLIHDALKGQEVVIPVAVHVFQRVHRAVVHDEAVAVLHHGPECWWP